MKTILDTQKLWEEFYPLSRWQRIEYLEENAGRVDLPRLIRYVDENCSRQGAVIVLSAPENADAQYGGYVFQRAGYLLFPRKVHIVNDTASLQRSLATGTVGAVIGYGVALPTEMSLRLAHITSANMAAACTLSEPEVL